MRWILNPRVAVGLAAALCLSLAAQEKENVGASRAATPPATTQSPPSLTDETRADIFMARKQYREAAELYLRILPQTAVLLNKAGIAYHQLGDLNSAKKYYQRSLKLRKDYPEAINNLGAVYYAQRSYRRAVNQYKKALKLSPDSASIHSNLGTALFARKKYPDAFAEYEKALSLDPDVFEHRSTQGVLLQERSVEEKAKFNYYLARTYARAGMEERALTYIRKALELGFKDKQKFLEEEDFAKVRTMPEFEALMKLEPRVL